MRKLFVTAAAAAGLTLAAATASAQVLPPVARPLAPPPPAVSAPRPSPSAPRPTAQAAAPVGIAAHHARLRNDPLLAPLASDDSDEGLAVDAMRVLLRDQGFGPGVTDGPMTTLPPSAELNDRRLGSGDELDALVVPNQPQAWLIQTDAGRWWLWESGAAAPGDMRAEVYHGGGRPSMWRARCCWVPDWP